MFACVMAAALALLPIAATAQQPGMAPAGPASSAIRTEPLPPPPPGAEPPPSPAPPAPLASSPPADASSPRDSAASPSAERVFCDQPVTVRLADRDAAQERYRPFIGIWSDAAWSPQLCAALIVTGVRSDGTASIVYVFGPMGSGRGGGGVLHGTGVIRDGELRFQNSDGSQFAFRPLYADLDGKLTTPQGQNFQAVFKKTL